MRHIMAACCSVVYSGQLLFSPQDPLQQHVRCLLNTLVFRVQVDRVQDPVQLVVQDLGLRWNSCTSVLCHNNNDCTMQQAPGLLEHRTWHAVRCLC